MMRKDADRYERESVQRAGFTIPCRGEIQYRDMSH